MSIISEFYKNKDSAVNIKSIQIETQDGSSLVFNKGDLRSIFRRIGKSDSSLVFDSDGEIVDITSIAITTTEYIYMADATSVTSVRRARTR